MADKSSIFELLQAAVLEGDAGKAADGARASLDAGIPPLEAIEFGLTAGIREVGERFGRMEMYLPEMVLSAKAMEAAVVVLEPHIEGGGAEKRATVLIGTVKGDIHDIGKNIAIALLRVNGFEVIDLGKDVSSDDFIEQAENAGAAIVGLSGLLTTSLPMMKEVIEIMEEDGVRERFKVIVGGGPTSQEYADEIGADGYAATAHDGVLFCEQVIEG